MKNLLALLCALLMFSSAALADTLTVDLDSATNEELRKARDTIDRCLSQRYLNPDAASGALAWRGDGNLEIGAFTCDAALYRILAYTNSPTIFTVTVEGETQETEITQPFSSYAFGPLICDGISVKAEMPWSLQISPIVEGGSVLDEGTGAFVGNLFTLDQPVNLRLKATWPEQDTMQFLDRAVTIHLVGITPFGKLEETEIMQASLLEGETAAQDYTLLPDARYERYFWHCECRPDVQWSIHMQ